MWSGGTACAWLWVTGCGRPSGRSSRSASVCRRSASSMAPPSATVALPTWTARFAAWGWGRGRAHVGFLGDTRAFDRPHHHIHPRSAPAASTAVSSRMCTPSVWSRSMRTRWSHCGTPRASASRASLVSAAFAWCLRELESSQPPHPLSLSVTSSRGTRPSRGPDQPAGPSAAFRWLC